MKRKGLFLLLLVSFFAFVFWSGVWISRAESQAHYTPKYAMEDIAPILDKEKLEDADYELIYRQTGLARVGVEELLGQGRKEALFYLQNRFFDEVEIECLRSNVFVQYERLREDATWITNAMQLAIPHVQNGDILISFSGHIFGWRYGHAAIVVDAEKGLTVEAVDLGSDSKLRSIGHWKEYPGFVLMRANGITQEQRNEIAAYAENDLVDIPYSVFSFGESEELPGTHCAHLVWYAYKRFGFDLDSDGGLIVTPADIFDSDLLQVVQIYGINPG